MTSESRLKDLLQLWEDMLEQGKNVSPEALCKDAPELLDELKRQIEILQSFPSAGENAVTRPTLSSSGDDMINRPTIPTGEADSAKTHPTLDFVIPGYNIIEELGRGGMGVVYKAWQVSLNRMVALKTMLSSNMTNAGEIARFRVEAEAVARIEHLNIVRIYEYGDTRGRPYFALEFVDGPTLADQLNDTPQPPRIAAALVLILARAMQFAHQRGVVHRDLKPSNILLGSKQKSAGSTTAAGDAGLSSPPRLSPPATFELDRWEPKIADFGLAKHLEGGPSLTKTGSIMGTPSYMAPEQAAGQTKSIGTGTDIYSLGVILYEMLTGRPPFMENTDLETIQRVVATPPQPPSYLRPGLPRDLETICLKCLEKKPQDRYATAEELGDDLQRFLDTMPIRAKPVSMIGLGMRWTRRHAGAVVVGAILMISLASLLVSARFWRKAEKIHEQEETQRAAEFVYREQEIRQKSAVFRDMLCKRFPTKEPWIPDELVDNAELVKNHNVWSHSQAVAALLLTPGYSPPDRNLMWTRLALPFDKEPPLSRDNELYGWKPSAEADYTAAPPALWTVIALAAALRKPFDETISIERVKLKARFNDWDRRQEWKDNLHKTQKLLRIYRPDDFEGGWHFFPKQKDKTKTSTYTTALALWALLETKQAVQTWEGDLQLRDDLLKKTVQWLDDHLDENELTLGWRESEDKNDRIKDGLTLLVHCLRLRAEEEAGLKIPERNYRDLTQDLVECSSRGKEYPFTSGQQVCKFTNFNGEEITRVAILDFPWFPWAVDGSVRWLKQAKKRNESQENIARIRHTLDHLVLGIGESRVKAALSGKTFVLAENLIGLSDVPLPEPR